MNILIVDEVHPVLMERLEGKGLNVSYCPQFNYDDTFSKIKEYDGLVVRSKFYVDEKLLRKGEKLKFVARAGVGLDIFDLKMVQELGIEVINASGANANSVAEHAIGILLSLMHNINKSSIEVSNYIWKREENRGEELYGKTVGLIGYGNTGKAFASKLKMFNCKVLAYDKYLLNFTDDYVIESSLEEIQMEADVLSLHIPLTEETFQLCDTKFFNNIRKSVYFLNTSRGKIIDNAALIDALDIQKIKGLGLDVLYNENIKELNHNEQKDFERLIKAPNVIITPHIAGWSSLSFKNISEVLSDKILSLTN